MLSRKKNIAATLCMLIITIVLCGCYGTYDGYKLIEEPSDVKEAVREMSNRENIEICDMAETEQWKLYACTADGEFGYYVSAIIDERGGLRKYGAGYQGGQAAEAIVLSAEKEKVTLGIISDGTVKQLRLHNDNTGEEITFELDKQDISAYIFECDWKEFSCAFIDANGNVIEN